MDVLKKGFASLAEGMASIFRGMAFILAPSPANYFRYTFQDRTDAEALAGDWAKVGADLHKAMQTIEDEIAAKK